MFPDSEIAKSHSQGETKVKYIIQFGIAPYIKQLILDDIKGKPFSFLFDETTTQQVKSSLMLIYNTGHLKINFQVFVLVLTFLGIATVTNYLIIFIILSKS